MSSVDVRDLRARGRGGLVLGPLSLTMRAGDVVAVTGAHGAGKSLLLACLAGLAPRSTLTGEARFVVPARVAMVFQRDALDDARTALENVVVASPARDTAPARALDDARAALVRVGLGAHAHKRPRALSGGMRKRVGIARALVAAPELVLADDPTAGLDPHTAREVLDALFTATLGAQSATSGAAVLLATTDVDVVLPRAPRALFLERGRVIFDGPPAALARDARTAAFAPRAHEEGAWQ